MSAPMMRRNVRRHKPVVLHPTIALDARFAIERLMNRCNEYSKAADENPDSPHALTWRSFATLLSGEALAIASATSKSLAVVCDRLGL